MITKTVAALACLDMRAGSRSQARHGAHSFREAFFFQSSGGRIDEVRTVAIVVMLI